MLPSLPELTCPGCQTILAPDMSAVRTATAYPDCLRRCDECGVGFSNARTGPTLIYRSPEQNVPEEVRSGVLDVLGQALNIRNRPQKLVKFGFSTSEDALTWTVFRYLQQSEHLALVFRALGVVQCQTGEPTVLYWGTPSRHSQAGDELRSRLIAICNELGENPLSRSEPDIILDFGDAGVVVIEVKYRSPNDRRPFDARYTKYVWNTTAFSDAEAVGRSGLCELARNWRIGVDLAAGRPFILMNLVKRVEGAEQMAQFCSGLSTVKGSFRTILWKKLISVFAQPEWLQRYLSTRL
jgi:hypothetical protein